MPVSSSGSSTFSTAEKTGMRLKAWKTKPIALARCSVRSPSDMANRSRPSTSTRPPSMSSSPDRQLSRVVLPDPDGPITPTSLAGADLEVEPVQCRHFARAGPVDLPDILGDEERFGSHSFTRRLRPCRV